MLRHLCQQYAGARPLRVACDVGPVDQLSVGPLNYSFPTAARARADKRITSVQCSALEDNSTRAVFYHDVLPAFADEALRRGGRRQSETPGKQPWLGR
jgi:hypothetical protein